MNVEERRRLYKKAVGKWGELAQIGMLVEECAELIVAINKERRYKNTESLIHLVEELADVEIMVEQVKYFLHLNDAVKNVKEQKLQRLRERLM